MVSNSLMGTTFCARCGSEHFTCIQLIIRIL